MPTFKPPRFAVALAKMNQGQYTGNNIEHKAYFDKIKKLTPHFTEQSALAFCGLIAFYKKQIENSFIVQNPKEKTLGMFQRDGLIDSKIQTVLGPEKHANLPKTGSTLHTLLSNVLGITAKNALDKYKYFVFIGQLVLFLKTQALDAELLTEVEAELQSAITACRTEFNDLFNRPYKPEVIKENFAKIPKDFDHTKETGRKQYMALIVFTDDFFKTNENPVDDIFSLNTVRSALTTFIMEELENEYLHSEFYERLQRTINLEKTTYLSNIEKYKRYCALHTYIVNLIHRMDNTFKKPLSAIPDVEQFLSSINGKLHRKIADLYEALQNGHIYPVANGIRIGINILMSIAMGTAIGMAAGCVSMSSQHRIASRFLSRIAANTRWGYAGQILALQAGRILEQAVLTAGISYAAKQVTYVVTEAPGNLAYHTLVLPFEINRMIQKLIASEPEPNAYEEDEFLDTAIALGDEKETFFKKVEIDKLQKVDIIQFVPADKQADSKEENDDAIQIDVEKNNSMAEATITMSPASFM